MSFYTSALIDITKSHSDSCYSLFSHLSGFEQCCCVADRCRLRKANICLRRQKKANQQMHQEYLGTIQHMTLNNLL